MKGKMTRKKIHIMMIPFSLLLLSGCTGRVGIDSAVQPVRVNVAVIAPVTESSDYYIGTVEESSSVPLSFMTTGMVEQVLVSEGRKVKKGEKLAVLNDENYSQAYQIALAKEKQAEDAYCRLSELFKKGSLPEIKFVEIQTSLDQARAATQVALKNLSYCELVSPAEGIIGKRTLEPGENVMPLKTVLTLIDIRQVKIKISVPEKEIPQILTSQIATIRLPALNEAIFTGKISEKGVMANPISHTYDVRIMVGNPSERLMPGMIGRVYLDRPDPAALILIPLNAVQTDEQGRRFVYLADPVAKKALKQIIVTATAQDLHVIVKDGLKTGDQLIVEGYQQLNENDNIEIIGRDEN
jgi:RND family efflux transporter MFP subunit